MKTFTAIAALSALIAASSAADSSSTSATSTISIPFPAVDPTDLALSVVTAAPSSTVYAIGCALNSQGAPKNDSCGWTSGFNPYITIAPNAIEFNITASPQEVDTYKCDLSSTSLGSCKTIVVEEVSKSKYSTKTYTAPDTTLIYAAATITAGLEKLSSSAASSSASGAGSSMSASGSGSSMSASGTGSTTDSSSSGTATAASSSTHSGSAARETGAFGLLAMAGIAGAGLLL